MRSWLCGLSIAILAAACSSPAAPTTTEPPPLPTPEPTLVGLWVGTAQELSCSGRACSPWGSYPGNARAFTITVIESGGGYQAFLDIDVRVRLMGELSGVAQADGSVMFHRGVSSSRVHLDRRGRYPCLHDSPRPDARSGRRLQLLGALADRRYVRHRTGNCR